MASGWRVQALQRVPGYRGRRWTTIAIGLTFSAARQAVIATEHSGVDRRARMRWDGPGPLDRLRAPKTHSRPV